MLRYFSHNRFLSACSKLCLSNLFPAFRLPGPLTTVETTRLISTAVNGPGSLNVDESEGLMQTTPLYIAAQNRLEVVRLLVESGANKDQSRTDTGATPLYIAAQEGYLEVVQFLVESGANTDQGRTDTGATPLYIAAQEGYLEVVQFLVESGANTDQVHGI